MGIEKILKQRLGIAILSIVFGIVIGFYLKKPSLNMMWSFDTEYKLKKAVKSYKSDTSLFLLENTNHWDGEIASGADFDFNWVAFFVGTTLMYLILLTNKYIDFKKAIYPYLKERYK